MLYYTIQYYICKYFIAEYIGANGNIFNLLGIAKKTLIDNGMVSESKEMCSKVYQCGSYSEALNVLGDYVNITSVDEDFEDETESVVMTV